MLLSFLLVSILLAMGFYIVTGTGAATGSATSRNIYTWTTGNEFAITPIEISNTSPSLAPGFYNRSRPIELPMLPNSQCRQDLTVYEILGNKIEGFFVDLAAHDWQWISNTLALERHFSWNGICIEPIPQYTKGILENRRCALVTSPVYSISNEHVTFKFDTYKSGIVSPEMDNKEAGKQSYSFVTVTLVNILRSLKAPPVIDYLSLDIEGAEFHAMKHFDFGMYTFLVVTIERPTEELHRLMTKYKYWFAAVLRDKRWASFGECLYVHESAPNFKKTMERYRVYDKSEIDPMWYNANHSYILEPPWPPVISHP